MMKQGLRSSKGASSGNQWGVSKGLTTEPQSTEASRTDGAEQKRMARCVGRAISARDCSMKSLMVAEVSDGGDGLAGKHLLCKHEDLSSKAQLPYRKEIMVTCANVT